MAYIDARSTIKGEVHIGKGTRINGPAFLRGDATAPILIKRYCAIGYNLCIQTLIHKTNKANISLALQNKHHFLSICDTKGSVTIGNNCWIGDNVCIMSGSEIGDGAIIGAGSVVTKNIPPFAIAYGVPAVVSKYRFTQSTIDQLLEIAWWEWDEEKISRNDRFFNADIDNYEKVDLYSLIVE